MKSFEIWKRLRIYELMLAVNLPLNILFYKVNEDYLQYLIPKEIAGYLFWLSLGLYLGFQVCKYEVKRIWHKCEVKEKYKKEDNMKVIK